MTKNVIELNGQKYDALTGKPIVISSKKLPTASSTKQSGPKHLDGFSRRPGAPKNNTISHVVHKKTEKSQTLMRTVVKKPVPAAKIHAKTSAHASATPLAHHKPVIAAEKPGRAIRATIIPQSTLISKFNKTLPTMKPRTVAVMPAPTADSKQQASKSAPAITKAISPVAQDPFHSAIENATSHEQPKLKKTKVHHKVARKLHVSPRVVTFVGMTLAVLSVGGILAYQNMPEIAMKVAATRAGLNASLPGYQPAGFALEGPIKYDHGEVTINYKSNTDARVFDVTQKNSSWNSETLLDNFVATTKQPYQTFQENGRTIYIYDGNKATWVDGGVWYNIDGKTNLNSDQLLRIADSL